jgi:predicted MPP superfamily phosphohydrolase
MIPMSPREKLSLLLFLTFILGVYGLETLLLVRYLLGRFRRGARKASLSTIPAMAVHVTAAMCTLCLLHAYFVEPYWIEVSRLAIRTPKLQHVGFRIVQISDLHCDRTPRNEERVVRIVNQLEPDIVVATGDYLNDASAVSLLRDTLGRLDAPLGKFAVTGNFEVRYWPGLDLLEGTGFRLLEHDKVSVVKDGERVNISGLGFGLSDAYPSLLDGVADEPFDVFLYHTPDLIEDIGGLGVDLYLCGHTHGGQVALPLYGALVTFSKFGKKYESGLYRCDGTMLYVNRGLGMEPRPAPQVRFLARPEIAVFDIRPEWQ